MKTKGEQISEFKDCLKGTLDCVVKVDKLDYWQVFLLLMSYNHVPGYFPVHCL